MKLGCMSLSYKDQFSAGKLDLSGFLDKAGELRLDGVDIHTRAFAADDPAYLRDIRMRCLKRGLAISYIGVSNNFGRPQEGIARRGCRCQALGRCRGIYGRFPWCVFLPRGFPKANPKNRCGRA